MRLRRYREAQRQNRELPFLGWLVVVARRVAIDYLRGHEAYIDRRHVKDASSPGAWRPVGPLPADSRLSGGRPPVTARGTVRQMLEFARDELPDD